MSNPQEHHENDTVLVWFRRDLRIDDNPALVAAVQSSRNVIPCFVWAPEEEGQFQPGRCSRWWLKQSLIKFEKQLKALGSRLIIQRTNDTSSTLVQLARETGAQGLFFNHLYDPISLVRDHEVKQQLLEAGVWCRSYNADLLYEPWEVLDKAEQPFTCFDGFWGRVLQMPYPPPFPLPAPASLPAVPSHVGSKSLQELDWFFTPQQEASSEQLAYKWEPGLEGAIKKLETFLRDSLPLFQHDRAKVDRESTSQLSPWIHQGTLSVRYIYYRVKQREVEIASAGNSSSSSCADFLQQMGYREYSRYLSFHFPFLHERSLLAHVRAVPWNLDQLAFKAWKQGLTGYPLVDAGMRELWATGWIHNRLRVVVASFLVKNLLAPWQWGLKHFWDALLDADLECDALGWQYVAGCMVDAHPFSYMIDMEDESRRFDPSGQYVRRWLPVLAMLPVTHIHAPWKAPYEVLAAAGVELGCNYPYPIISKEESQSQVASACQVIDRNSVENKDAVPRPFRPATLEQSTPSQGVSQPVSKPNMPVPRWGPARGARLQGEQSWGVSSEWGCSNEEVCSNDRSGGNGLAAGSASASTAASSMPSTGPSSAQVPGLAVPSISTHTSRPYSTTGEQSSVTPACSASQFADVPAAASDSKGGSRAPPSKKRHLE